MHAVYFACACTDAAVCCHYYYHTATTAYQKQDGQVHVYDIARGGRCTKSVHALVKWSELKRLTAIAVTSTAVTAASDTPVSGSASKAARAHDVIAVGGESGLIMLWHQVCHLYCAIQSLY
jgi:3-hydroxyisobutyrate dehydrogenase-like beta-hydroxyacid dehydrogenase